MRLLFTALLVFVLHGPAWAGPKSARVDALGDPLPDHAVARLGTTRWRQHWSVLQLVYSRDGKTVTAKSYEEGVCVFDAKTGTRLTQINVRNVPYGLFTFSGDGRWFAMTSTENRAGRVVPTMVDVSSSETGKTRSSVSLGNVKAIALSGEGTLLATADQGAKDPAVTLWDAVKGKTLWQAPVVATELQFSPDNKTLLIANDKRLRLWDVASGKEQRRIEGDARKFALSQDGKTLATRGDNFIRIVDFASGDERRRIPTREDVDTRYDRLALSSDGALVALAGHGYLLAWETATGKHRFERKSGWGQGPLAFAPWSSILTWSGNGPVIHRRDLAAGEDLQLTPGHFDGVKSVAFFDAETVLSSGSDAQAYRWKLGADATRQPSFSTLGSSGDIASGRTAASADGKRLAVVGPGPNVTLLDAMSGKRLRTLEGGPMLFALAFSPDGKHVAAGDTFYGNDGQYRGRVYIWNADTGARTHFFH
jgi:WD40 repeat protein